ncbi:MAG TPA: hypothetical protein DCY76_02855 [Flavobacteriales bacterium]|nr:hypothetical protein [Flavobacteriales bacterium]|tara:strand:- start:188 stop:706 length:519 start_codon:yes stop_codon:yes gene_type:complete
MSDTTTSQLQTARAALDRCQDLLADESPAWAELHAALNSAQRAIAIAEYASDLAVTAPPVEEMEAEAVVAPAPEEQAPLPAAGASLAERLSEQRLESLKNSLSINNRVRFASLLTDGDVPALLKLCDALEASDNFEAAQVLILETAGDVDWDDEENGGVEFLSLVRRLFATA